MGTLEFAEADLEETTTRVFVAYLAVNEEMVLPIGALSVDRESDSVELVFVQKQYRRKGVARLLLLRAQEAVGKTLVDTGRRSGMGQQWAESVGLKRLGERKVLSSAEAEEKGNRLMIALYTAGMKELTPPVESELEKP